MLGFGSDVRTIGRESEAPSGINRCSSSRSPYLIGIQYNTNSTVQKNREYAEEWAIPTPVRVRSP